MTDIVSLGLAVDSRQVATANTNLDQFVGIAGRADAANDNLARGFRNVAQHAAGLPGPIGASAARLLTFASGAAAAATAVIGMSIAIGTKAVEAFAQLQAEQAAYNAVLAATRFSAGRTGDEIEEMASSIRRATTATEGDVRKAAATLASFGAVSGEQFDLALRLSKDLATVMGGDMSSAASVFGRALQSPLEGMTMLRRAGILLTETQKQQIKDFVEGGNRAKAAEIILAEVQRRVGGAGASVGGGLVGAYNQLGEATNNLLEAWGQQITKAFRLDSAIRGIASAIDAVNQQAEKSASPAGRLASVDTAIAERRARPSSMIPALDQANQKEINKLLQQRRDLLLEVEDAERGVAMQQIAAAKGADAATEQKRVDAIAAVVFKLKEEGDELKKTAIQREIDKNLKAAEIKNTDKLSDADRTRIEQMTRSNFIVREGVALASQRIALLGTDASVGEQVEVKRRELNKQIKEGVKLSKDEIALILERTRVQAENAQPENQIAFERQMLGLSEQEARVRERIRSLSIDINSVRGQQLAQELRITEQLKLTQDIANEALKGFLSDLRAGTSPLEAFANALSRISDRITNLGLDNLVRGLTGMNTSTMFAANDNTAQSVRSGIQQAQRDSMSQQAGSSLGLFSSNGNQFAGPVGQSAVVGPMLPQQQNNMLAGTPGGYAIGGFSAIGAGINAYRSGQATGTKGGGALNGALTGGMSGAGIGFMLGGPVGAAIGAGVGAVAGGIAGFFGGDAAKKKAEQQRQVELAQQAEAGRYRARGIELSTSMIGVDTSTRGGALRAAETQHATDIMSELQAGGQAMAALEANYQATRLDIIKQFNERSLQTQKDAEENLLANDPLSAVAARMKEIDTVADTLRKALVDLGQSTDAVTGQVTAAVDKLRGTFVDDINRSLNALGGKGYLNDLADLVKATAKTRADAALLGNVDTSLVDRLFSAQAQKIVEDAGLVGSAFSDLAAVFPDLNGVVHQATDGIENLRQTIDDYLNGLQLGALSTLSQGDQLAAAQARFDEQMALARASDAAAQANITQTADALLQIARQYLGPSTQYGALYSSVTSQLSGLPGAITGDMPRLGMVNGGMVGNGRWGIDSVRAAYAGGGSIMLAGGEYVMPAAQTAANLPALQAMHNGTGANDNSGIVAELRAQRKENAAMWSALLRVAIGGNELARELVAEMQGSRTDTRQKTQETFIRAKAS